MTLLSLALVPLKTESQTLPTSAMAKPYLDSIEEKSRRKSIVADPRNVSIKAEPRSLSPVRQFPIHFFTATAKTKNIQYSFSYI